MALASEPLLPQNAEQNLQIPDSISLMASEQRKGKIVPGCNELHFGLWFFGCKPQ